MTSFEELKEKPDRLLSLTGYTLEEFTELSPHFTKCFLAYVQTHTLTGKPRKKRQYKPYKNSSFDTFEDMLLFILIYLREAPKQELFGALFDMSQPLANRWIHLLLPILNQALAALEALPSRETLPAPMCDVSEVSPQSQEGNVSEVSTQSQEGDVSEVSTQSQEGELFFFMMAQSGRSSAPKTHPRKRRIIVAKRNAIP